MKKSDLQKKGGEVQAKTAEIKNQLARVLADYDNLRKRVEQEREVWAKFSAQVICTRLLPILDILEGAQNHLKDQGLAIAISEFKKVFNEEGLKESRPVAGETFDPKVHEAIELVDGGEKGEVAELILPGWMYNEARVLRHAKVRVYGERVKEEKI